MLLPLYHSLPLYKLIDVKLAEIIDQDKVYI